MNRRAAFARTALGLAATLALTASAARADGPWSGTVTAATDYVFRGVSQTYGGAALQAGASYQHDAGWFGGAWASNVDPFPGGSGSVELDLYAGYVRTFAGDWSARASYTRYQYVWDPRPRPYDYGEFAVTVSFRDLVAATVSYEPDTTRYATPGYARGRASTAYELSARWPLRHGLALTASGGYYDLERVYGTHYLAGSAGLHYEWRRLALELTRFYADGAVRRLYEDASADGRWVLSASYRF
ncbi:MAG: hypothetical protein JSR73_06940 [Proteobacteria bacterium]|nr:hypothetical protein [Pseudomonadota bacterium]